MLVTAFIGEEGETVVLLNRSQHEIYCSIPPGMHDFSYLEHTSQYYRNHVELLQDNKEILYNLRILPGEIITLSSVKLNSK